MEAERGFLLILSGIIFNPKERTILIGKRENDPYVSKLTWTFPGGIITPGKDLESSLKKKIKKQTGLDVENLGCILARVPPEKENFVLIYFLCEAIGGTEKAGGNLKEMKWVKAGEIGKYFTTSFHPHLKEYILNLK